MGETHETEEIKSKPRKLSDAIKHRQVVRPSEVLIITAFAVIILALTTVVVQKLVLKHDIANARTVSDSVIMDIQARNGNAVRALGTSSFKSSYSGTELTKYLQGITVATLEPPAMDHQFVGDGTSGRTVFFIYKYTALKVPYYIRTAIVHKSNGWRLTAITGNIDEAQLLSN